jgi:hypothetical protein
VKQDQNRPNCLGGAVWSPRSALAVTTQATEIVQFATEQEKPCETRALTRSGYPHTNRLVLRAVVAGTARHVAAPVKSRLAVKAASTSRHP